MKYRCALIEHKGENRIAVYFEPKFDYINRFKKLIGAKWSSTLRVWHLPDNVTYRKQFGIPLKTIGKNAYLHIHEINHTAFSMYIELLQLKAYSSNTIKVYSGEFAQFLKSLQSFNVDLVGEKELKGYLLYCIKNLKMSENHVQSRINAIKFYFEQVLKKPKIVLDLPRPKKPSKLPKVINAKDIEKMLRQIKNLKHQLMLKMVYGMGLRVSEIVQMKISDIDSKSMQVHIQSAKGKKDRYVNLPNSVLENLRAYYLEYKPKVYLFEGQYGGQYSIRSVQLVFKQSMIRSKINKKVGIHSLRHSFATHLLEQGTDISYIQKLLGHNNIKTTLIYTQVGEAKLKQIVSPLDKLNI